MSAQLSVVENEMVDEGDLAMVRAVLEQKAIVTAAIEDFNTRRKEVTALEQQVTTAALELQGADKFLHKHLRDKYHIEGNFEVKEDGQIIRLPTAEVG